jgi:hypothetical protein
MASILTVTVDDLVDAYEGAIDTQDAETQKWLTHQIGKAERALIGECPSLPRRIVAGSVDVELVRDVVVDAVLRLVRDEDPTLKTESENGYSYSKNALSASANIWFPDKDLARIGCKAVDAGFVGTARVSTRAPWAGGWR